ncbi:F-box family protein, partial [Trifolium medium]|nr:F-box family protein [Trifolium medium]
MVPYKCTPLGQAHGVTARPVALVRNLSSLWKSWVPLKVIVFSWQLLQDRIPSRQNLLRRKVLPDPDSAICALCGLSEESFVHLFISCPVVSSVWYTV